MTKRVIGQGESRTAWLINGVVYKVGRNSANLYEHEALTAWREAGASWAPPTTLYRCTIWPDGQIMVVAMPYLPDDGSAADDATLAEIRRVAPQTCRENYTTHAGRTHLIDGGDIERFPAATTEAVNNSQTARTEPR